MEKTSFNPTTYQDTIPLTEDIKNYKEKPIYPAKWKRTFHSAMSGMAIAQIGKKPVRFITLTTSELCLNQLSYNSEADLNDHFQTLKKRILRYTPNQLLQEGYISKRQLEKYYNPHEYNTPFKIKYLKIITSEGNGVIHILYLGSYLPQPLLSNLWQDIHLTWNVDIRKIRTDPLSLRKSSAYVCQYISTQEGHYTRTSASWEWVKRGYKKTWKNLLETCRLACYYNPVQRKYYKKHKITNPFKTALKRWQLQLTRIAHERYVNKPIMTTLIDYG